MPAVPLSLDALIVGHGLAGAVLAHVLAGAGWRVLVIDEPNPDAASRVAAGLVNPLAGRRFALSWRAAELLPAADVFYRAAEAELGCAFWYRRPIHKFFGTIEEANTGAGKADGSTPFVEAVLPPVTTPALHAPLGGLQLGGGGFLHTEAFLDALAAHRRRHEQWRTETFRFDRLVSDPAGLRYSLADGTAVAARYLFCCEGAAATANPFFHWLPLVPNKGEVLDVNLPPGGLPDDVVYNQSVYLVPHGAGRWRVGATYDYRSPTPDPTPEGRADLLQRLAKLTPLPAEVTAHRAGRRPAVRDRRPLVGFHPAHPRVAIFNGFGSKGVSIAPGLARHLLAVLETRETLWPEVNIARFSALYAGGPGETPPES